MKGFIGEYIEQLHREKSRHRKVSAWTSMLALLVVFTVVWGLRVKGISLTNDTDCGIEEHIHDEGCYQIYQICGLSEGDTEYKEVQNENGEIVSVEVLHAHTDACYERELSCLIPEHVHTVACVNLEELPENIADSSLTPDEESVEEENEIALEEELEDTAELEEEESEELVEQVLESEIALYASSYVEPDQGMLSIEKMVEKAYQAHLDEMKKAPGDRDQSKIIRFGEFYVVTATGLRYKHKVMEHLGGTTPDGGTTWDEDGDGVYMQNANVDKFRYLLCEDSPLTLVVFRTPGMSDNYIYAPDNLNNNNTNIEHKVDEDGKPTRNSYVVDLNDFSAGYSATYVHARGGQVGNNGTFAYANPINNTTDHFYTHVQSADSIFRHADIEIADGGFFKIETRREFEDGTYQVIKTRYDSFVSEVYKANVYFKNGSKLLFPGAGTPNKDGPGLDLSDSDNQYCGPDKSIYSHNNIPGQTQYEITSAYYTYDKDQYHFRFEDVKNVVFTVELSLAPMTSTIETYDKDGHLIGDPVTKNFAKDDGTYDYTVKPLQVNLGQQSILDAINKCPDHSGMDFNLLYTEVNLELTQPTTAVFPFTKYLDSDNTLGHNVSEFVFELLDGEGNRIDEVHPQSPSGNIEFPVQDFPIPGQYKYKVREVIPNGAGEIEPGVFSANSIIYDGRVIDIVVDVQLMTEIDEGIYVPIDILAVVDDSEVAKKTRLVATPHYYINGVEIDTSDPDEAKKLEFHNGLGDYKVKDLIVEKEWIGGGNHDDDKVTFRVIRKRNNESSQYYSFKENTVFELNKDNGWRFDELKKLPVIIGTDTYSYEVVETAMLGYSPSYEREDYEDRIVYKIKNTANTEKYLHFEKIWKDDEGGNYVPPDDCDEVSLKLMREFKDNPIPVKIKIQTEGAGEKYSNEFDLTAYEGQSIEFKLEMKEGEYYHLNLARKNNCEFSQDGDKYTISEIQPGAEVVLTYPKVTAEELIYWCTEGADFTKGAGYNQWQENGGILDDCYYTNWSNNGSGGVKAMMLLNRRADWNYARLSLDPEKCVPGEQYSFSAYIMYRQESRANRSVAVGSGISVEEKPEQLKIQLNYKLSGSDTVIYRDIAVIDNPSPDTWYQVQETGFTIPDKARNIEIQVNTKEDDSKGTGNDGNNIRYVDLYFDDVIIAPYMYKAGVEENSGILATERLFNMVDEKRSVPESALKWTPDEGEVTTLSVKRSDGWRTSLKLSDLGGSITGRPELLTRSYRYYVIESPTVLNYKPFYLDDYVAYNYADNPITVENQYHAYVLPNTGGIGPNRIRWLGLLILLAGIPPALVNLVRKRGRPSG